MTLQKVLVTGSAGHLGDALTRVLRDRGYQVTGLDVLDSPGTDVTGSIADRDLVRSCLDGVSAVLHTATLHKPHVASHGQQDFVDTNVTGTLTLAEEAAAAGVGSFVFTSSTSAFGRALTPAAGQPAAWITEDVAPVPRNIYGVTKTAAENLCEIIQRDRGLPVVVLRTARFFPEGDDADQEGGERAHERSRDEPEPERCLPVHPHQGHDVRPDAVERALTKRHQAAVADQQIGRTRE